MDHPPNIRSRQPGRHLKSVAGAFDLPSILVGVVVVGILTAGVLAAIFGVIPFAQVNAAKQDLAAINTAQGVTYAKDDQTYKALAGLEDAGLVSGLDSETTEVTIPADGKGFTAIVTAGNGEKWFITHDDPTPRMWEEPPAAPAGLNPAAWASEYCTPAIVEATEYYLMQHAAPGVVEMAKMGFGMPYDQGIWESYIERYVNWWPELSDEETAITGDILWPARDLRDGTSDAVGLVGNAAMTIGELEASIAEYVAAVDPIIAAACQGYPGPGEPYPPETFEHTHAAVGSMDPMKVSVSVEGATDQNFTAVFEAYSDTKYGSQLQEFTSTQKYEVIDGTPQWTLTLTPGPGGWKEDVEIAYEVAISRLNASPHWAPLGWQSVLRPD